ncbi:MAG: aminotransferase class V-fold PLP-dependent enzyme [Phycisphaerae bacterium]|nr:aminotransferase class V-fold PLP-dependent enzyme [Phycisphaerae bacterium]
MNKLRPLYMDNAATSFPKPKAVWEAMQRYATDCGASPGRGGYRQAREINAVIAECRQRIAQLINAAAPETIVFTSNCTEAINTAIQGLIDPKVGGHAICTHTDHNSILRPINAMAENGWISQTRVAIDPATGRVDPEDIRRAIRPDTRLITITHGSNVTGAVQPIRAISRIAREASVPFIVDAAQTIGHWPIDVIADGIDLLAAPGHKALLGPPGTGFLYLAPGMESRVRPLKQGGTGSNSESPSQPMFMPDRFESGSLNAIGIAGLLEGVKWVQQQRIESLSLHQTELIKTFIEGVGDIAGLSLFGASGVRDRVGVFSVRLEGVPPEALSESLEEEFGILTRSGLHCAPLVHRAIGTADIGGTTRFSFGAFLTLHDVQYATDALGAIAIRNWEKTKPAKPQAAQQ